MLTSAHVVLDAEGALDVEIRQTLADRGFSVLAESAGSADEIVLVYWTKASRDRLRTLLGAEREAARMVVILEEPPTAWAARVLHARAEGSLMAADVRSALGPTLEAVAAGQSAHPLAWREALDHPLLSTREKQILAMVVLGLTNGEIAGKLHVTESNVKFHLTSAFGKLGVRSREQATALILDPDAGLGPGILRIVPEEDDGAAQR